VPVIEEKPSQVKFDTDRPKNTTTTSAFLKKHQTKTIDQSHTSDGNYFVPSSARRKAVISIKTRQDLIVGPQSHRCLRSQLVPASASPFKKRDASSNLKAKKEERESLNRREKLESYIEDNSKD
jgi:hypothetical protein